MRPHTLYKHENMLDVAILPLKVGRYHPDYYTVKLRWFNVQANQIDPSIETWDMGIQETHKIKVKDMKKWRLYEVRRKKA